MVFDCAASHFVRVALGVGFFWGGIAGRLHGVNADSSK
jgi:hypothetical protein